MVQAKVDNPVGQGDASVDSGNLWSCSGAPGYFCRVFPICEGAAIYGSWASRRSGVAGHVPNDIDVLVVGSPFTAEAV